MPMLDAYIPEGALTADAETALLAKLTDVLLEHEGADPNNPRARSLAKVWLFRPATVLHAGCVPIAPHYRFVASVPQGQFDDQRRASMVRAVTEAVLDAEDGRHTRDPLRVWVFTHDVPDGTWGGGGTIHRLADIAGIVMGDAEKGRAYAARRLRNRPTGQALSGL